MKQETLGGAPQDIRPDRRAGCAKTHSSELLIQRSTNPDGHDHLDQEFKIMGKRGAYRRGPGDEPDIPDDLKRPNRLPLPPLKPLPDLDIAAIRRKLNLSQARFAHRFGFSVATLRHWEQGNRKPHGCALALLHVINYHPAVATQAILKAKQLRCSP